MTTHTKEMFARATDDTRLRDRLTEAMGYGEYARRHNAPANGNPYHEDTTDGLMWSVGWNLEDSRRRLQEALTTLYVAQPWRIAKALYGKHSWPVKDGVSGVAKTLEEVHRDFDRIFDEQGRSDELDVVEDAIFEMERHQEEDEYQEYLAEQDAFERGTTKCSTMHHGMF